MDIRVLKPARLDLNPDNPTATRDYMPWLHSFEIFAATLVLPANYEARIQDGVSKEMVMDQLKLDTLTNLISADIWFDIKDCTTYNDAKTTLNNLFVKKPSEVYARYKLQTAKQQPGQTLGILSQGTGQII